MFALYVSRYIRGFPVLLEIVLSGTRFLFFFFLNLSEDDPYILESVNQTPELECI